MYVVKVVNLIEEELEITTTFIRCCLLEDLESFKRPVLLYNKVIFDVLCARLPSLSNQLFVNQFVVFFIDKRVTSTTKR